MPEFKRGSESIYIGIDPGASGGIAAIIKYGLDATPMPATEADVWAWFARRNPDGMMSPMLFACIELVTGYVGGDGNTGSSMFKFGTSYGALRMALTASSIPFEAVQPNVWQKALGIPRRAKDEKKGQFKNRLKAKAQQLFPSHADLITLKTADAVLIAEYCRRKREGVL